MVAGRLLTAPEPLLNRLPDIVRESGIPFDDVTKPGVGLLELECSRNRGTVALFVERGRDRLHILLHPFPRWAFFRNPASETLLEDLLEILQRHGASDA